MTASQISSRTSFNAALGAMLVAQAAIWLVVSAFTFFGGMEMGSIVVMTTPVSIALLLGGLALFLGEFPRLTPVGVVASLISTAMLAWVGYEFYHVGPETEPPPLAQGYDLRAHLLHPIDFEDPAQSARWTALLQKRFPIGSSAAELQRTLDDQHFSHGRMREGSKFVPYGEYGWFVGPCYYGLTVRWHASADGRITRIEGQSTLTDDMKSSCN